ncbi:MAG: exo-alpha-sialidase [Lysobacteraceae bacterium]|nr:MAG: exo-alpha-sialidase [Xanthomonadaceae bacterium]
MRHSPTLRAPFFVIALALLAGCGNERIASSSSPESAQATGGGDEIEIWPLPAQPGAAQPDLAVAPDGRLLLSWINAQQGRRPALQFAEFYADGHWEGPRTIVVGNALFVNWADTPHIIATADRGLWVHWLQKSADAPYAYDVMLARSLDHGMNWSAPVRVHDDGTQTEHGFVSMWPQSHNTLGMAWLDGRNTPAAGAEHGGGEHGGGHDKRVDHMGAGADPEHSGGMMTVRAAVFDPHLRPLSATQVDASSCDCCQTDVATTSEGALLVYRDRREGEIRDIYASRFDGKTWSEPRAVHADDWKMPACPVNGPSVAAEGAHAYVGWYTAAGDVPTVMLARSTDAGTHFEKPRVVDRGEAVHGRVAVAVQTTQVWVVWLREEHGAQSLWLARYSPDLSRELQRIELAKLQGKGRATGFPKLALRQGALHAVWTDVIDGRPQLFGARVGSQR